MTVSKRRKLAVCAVLDHADCDLLGRSLVVQDYDSTLFVYLSIKKTLSGRMKMTCCHRMKCSRRSRVRTWMSRIILAYPIYFAANVTHGCHGYPTNEAL